MTVFSQQVGDRDSRHIPTSAQVAVAFMLQLRVEPCGGAFVHVTGVDSGGYEGGSESPETGQRPFETVLSG